MTTGSTPIGLISQFPKFSPPWQSYAGECNTPVYDGNVTFDLARSPTIFKTLNAVVITTSTALWTPAAGKKFRLLGGMVSVGTAAGNVLIQDAVSGSTIFILPKQALDTVFYVGPFGNGILSAAANNALAAIGASTATISGTLWGTEE